MEGRRAAAGWSESSRTSSHSVPRYAAPYIPVIASETKQSSKLCTHANACDFIAHWIATVAMLPREDKKHHAKFPSMEGCRAAAGWSESSRTSSPDTLPHTYLSLRVKRSNPVNQTCRVCDTIFELCSLNSALWREK